MADEFWQRPEDDSREPLRDWQRDTWLGPYPGMENPFDEPEDAPELLEARSEALTNRSGDFWRTQTNGYAYGTKAPEQGTTAAPVKKTRTPMSPRRKWILAAGIAAGIAAVCLILYFGVFSVRTILVQGNDQIPASEIIRLSGIRTGMPVFSLREEEIERGIERNPALKFRYYEKELPGTVILRVQEREACCWMTWNGIIYTMDKQRIVLYESEVLPSEVTGGETDPGEDRELTEQEKSRVEEQRRVATIIAGLVRVDGLNVRSGALAGQTLALEDALQQTVFSELFLEMKVLSCTALILEADLSNLDSLLLTTRDGFTVALGDSRNIHAKLRSMLLTREELLRRGYQGGVINVTLPETPIFSPSEG